MTKSLNYDKETKQVQTLKLNEAFLFRLLGIFWTEKQYYPIYLFRHTHWVAEHEGRWIFSLTEFL